MARNGETNIEKSVLLELGGQRDVLAWKQMVGSFRAIDDPQRIVRVGVPGMADVMTVQAVTITPDMVGKTIGVAVAHEVKTLTGKQRDNQKLWQLALELKGGIYFLSRSAEQAYDHRKSVPEIIRQR
jgi:hypothetical protein